MIRKPRKLEHELLIEEVFDDEELVSESVKFFSKKIKNKGTLTANKNYDLKNDDTDSSFTYKPFSTKVSENTSENSSCKDNIGLVTKTKKAEVTPLPSALKKFSICSDSNKTYCQPDIVRVSEAQVFVDADNKHCGRFNIFGESSSKFNKKNSSYSLDYDANDDRGGSSYRRISKEKDKKSHKKSIRQEFRKFFRRGGSRAWKGLKGSWGFFQGSLKQLAGPLMTFDVPHEALTGALKFRGQRF